MDITQSDEGHHSIEEIFDEKIRLQRIVPLFGTEVINNIEIREDDILQNEPFDREPDGEHYNGYTGNAGADATHWYRSS